MGTDSDSKFTPNPSQGEYWDGFMVDASLYKFFAMFPITGILGIDHLVLRSPLTALLKLLINIFFYGAWYFYDMIQILTDSTFVANYGMSTPWGPRGHGYKLFSNLTENNINEFPTPSRYYGGFFASLMFLLYVFLTIALGFTGLPAILAGDFTGGITKLFTNFFFLPFLFYLVSMPYEFYKSTSVEKTGVSRTWPLAPWFMLKLTHPAVNLLGKEEGEKQLKEYTTSLNDMVKDNKKPILQELFIKTVETVWGALTNFPPVAAFTAVTATKGAALAASDVGQSLAKAVQKRVATDPDAVIDSILGKAQEAVPTVPVVAVPEIMKGGAILDSTGEIDRVVFGGIAVLVLGGLVVGFLRKFTVPKRENDDEHPGNISKRDDSPPNPGAV